MESEDGVNPDWYLQGVMYPHTSGIIIFHELGISNNQPIHWNNKGFRTLVMWGLRREISYPSTNIEHHRTIS